MDTDMVTGAVVTRMTTRVMGQMIVVRDAVEAENEPMPKRKEPELTPAEQFKRFRETVKKLEVDESGKPLNEAFKKIKPKPAKRALRDDA